MCGITGVWDPKRSPQELLSTAEAMTQVLLQRGPDGAGLWQEPRGGLALGHRRLAILDLSDHGRQPMISESGRYVVTYNGELYNLDELRDRLGRKPSSFRGHSDTEVALAAVEKFGLREAVQSFNGMFAFALWDREEQDLYLVRDRLGIKPLFFGRAGSALLFASQASSLRQDPGFDKALSPAAVSAYLETSCVPAPLCIHKNASKVMPGTIVRFASSQSEAIAETYWDPLSIAMDGQTRTNRASNSTLVDELEELLTDSVRRRMISDVPLGAFLSGGIDSSTIVALMAKLSDRPVKTFTIGSRQASHDESSEAETIANQLGTEHHTLIATPSDAIEVVGELQQHYDEPFADSSQIPTFLVSRLARDHVTVSLSGDGGDELFGGYNRHVWGPKIARLNRQIPWGLRRHLGAAMRSLRPETLDWIYNKLVPQVGPLKMRLPADKAIKLGRAISSRDEHDMYRILVSSDCNPHHLLQPAFCNSQPAASLPPLEGIAHKFMFQDMIGYLPDDILTKVDRASMAVSLEARVPLLDHRVVEFAWTLPLRTKLAEGQGKWILRQVLGRHLPASRTERPKSGFSIPIGEWLKGPLREWGQGLLESRRIEEDGIFHTPVIKQTWQEHLSGRRDNSRHLWDLLMFQDWLEKSC